MALFVLLKVYCNLCVEQNHFFIIKTNTSFSAMGQIVIFKEKIVITDLSKRQMLDVVYYILKGLSMPGFFIIAHQTITQYPITY